MECNIIRFHSLFICITLVEISHRNFKARRFSHRKVLQTLLENSRRFLFHHEYAHFALKTITLSFKRIVIRGGIFSWFIFVTYVLQVMKNYFWSVYFIIIICISTQMNCVSLKYKHSKFIKIVFQMSSLFLYVCVSIYINSNQVKQ